MEIKGSEFIEKMINDFTMENFGIHAVLDTEFLAYCEDKVIGYTYIYEEYARDYFIKDAQKRFPEINADIFLWCLFHEIGHVMTNDVWTEADTWYFAERKEELANTIEDDQTRFDLYHSIADEYVATNWAGNFMKNHADIVGDFWNRLQPAMQLMFFINDLI